MDPKSIQRYQEVKARAVSLEFSKHEHLRALALSARLAEQAMWVDDEITACRWGIDEKGRVFRRLTKTFLMTTKNPAYAQWNPGVRTYTVGN